MLAELYFYRINTICVNEFDKGKKLAIFPVGQVGSYVKNFVQERYGQNVVCIDNFLCKYNKDIISLDDFMKVDSARYTIILCATNQKLNRTLISLLSEKKIQSSIVNLLEAPIERHDEKKDFFATIKTLLEVGCACDKQLIRIGEEHDGGYVMLDDFESIDVAYSFGISTNSMWDLDMAEKGIDVYCYDPSVSGIIGATDKIHFFRYGITDTKHIGDRYFSLLDLLQKNNHIKNNNMILKFDIEGAEWDVLDDMDVDLLARFNQISCELHNIVSADRKEQIIRCLEKLTFNHSVVWVHGNNAGRVEMAGNIIIPEYLELTLVRKDLYKLEECNYNCPIEIDAPNTDIGFDIQLLHWNNSVK